MNPFLRLLTQQVSADARRLPGQVRARARRHYRERAITIDDLRAAARRSVPRAVFDFVDGAARDEVTAARNRRDFDLHSLLPKVLVDVSALDTSTTVLGEHVAVPILGAPTGLTGLIHHRGEAGVANAVHAAGSIYVLSAMASYSIEEMAVEAPGPTWFQLYVWRDRGLVCDLLDRARAAGHTALVVTVDVPRAGIRERDHRNGFGIPPRLTMRSLAQGLVRPTWSAQFVRRPRMDVANAGGRAPAGITLTEYINTQFDSRLCWEDLSWLRDRWSGPLVVKGVLRPDDARRAASIGADGVIVSNHGGRQLDHASSAIRALPPIVDAIGGTAEVYVDGGIRRGTDVLKALALGARACLVGRPLIYGLGAGGDAGAAHAMRLLVEEVRVGAALLGCPVVREIDRSWLSTQPARA